MAWDPPVYPYKNVTEYIVWIWKGIKFIGVHRPVSVDKLITATGDDLILSTRSHYVFTLAVHTVIKRSCMVQINSPKISAKKVVIWVREIMSIHIKQNSAENYYLFIPYFK